DLGHARDALGSTASPAELTAGAAALRAGASQATLAQLRHARGESLTVPLAVLADLVASGVPVDSAAAAVLGLAARARDADLVEFRRAVERDIALGAPPAAAVTARGTYLRFESGRRSLQGLIAASLFTPPSLLPHRWRGELSLSAGGSNYADFASFWHATGEARLHYVGAGRGAWIGGTG